MIALALILLFQTWGRFESRGAAAEAAILAFRADYEQARCAIAPTAEVVLEFPETGLAIAGERAIAITTWRNDKFLVVVDWRALLLADPLVRPFIPVHEVCHLRHVDYIRRDTPLTQGERMKLEMDAAYCSMVYVAQQTERRRASEP